MKADKQKKQKIKKDGKQFVVNPKRGIVYCTMKYNGVFFNGEAKLNDSDIPNIEYGKAIAHARADVAIRKEIRDDAWEVYSDLSTHYNASPVSRRLAEAARIELVNATHFYNRQLKMLHELLREGFVKSQKTYDAYLAEAQQIAAVRKQSKCEDAVV